MPWVLARARRRSWRAREGLRVKIVYAFADLELFGCKSMNYTILRKSTLVAIRTYVMQHSSVYTRLTIYARISHYFNRRFALFLHAVTILLFDKYMSNSTQATSSCLLFSRRRWIALQVERQ
jgi:hypothetical protein